MSIKVKVTQRDIERAKYLESLIPSTIKKSIKGGEGILGGCIAEIIVGDFFRDKGFEVVSNEEETSFSHDLLVKKDHTYRVEIKCTERTFFVKDDYHVHVAKSQYGNQKKSDWFCFTSLKYETKTKRDGLGYRYSNPEFLEIVGFYESSRIQEDFLFRAKGEFGEDTKPAVWDEYYIPIKKLRLI